MFGIWVSSTHIWLLRVLPGSLDKHVQEGLVIVGNMTVGGTISKVEELANILQVCVDAGAKKILLPAPSAGDFYTVPSDLIVKVQPIFYLDPIDAVYKALGVSWLLAINRYSENSKRGWHGLKFNLSNLYDFQRHKRRLK